MYDDDLVAQLHALLQGYAIQPEHLHALVHLLDETVRSRPEAGAASSERLRAEQGAAAPTATFIDLGLIEEVEHFRLHRGRDPVLHRRITLLVPTARPGAERAVRREGLLLARLRHPCVGAALQVGALDDGTPAVALERSEGTPLARALRGATPETAQDVLLRTVRLLARVCEALEHAHQQGVVHRAIFDQTVEVAPFGRARIGWWGWALDRRHAGPDEAIDDHALIRVLTARGADLPPEVLELRREAQGPWTDVFGVGALLRRALSTLPLDPVPEVLLRLAEEATQADPALRPQTAGCFAEALTRWSQRAVSLNRAEALLARAEGVEPGEAAACLHGALQLDAGNARARARLSAMYLRRVREAALGGGRDRAAEALLDAVAPPPPPSQRPTRVQVRSSPDGARVTLMGWREIDRHLRPHPLAELGSTPVEVPLRPGSYALRLEAPGCAPVTSPLLVEPPEDGADPCLSHEVELPPERALSPDEVYVPAGWTLWGDADPGSGALPRQRSWVPAFVAQKATLCPSTLAETLGPDAEHARALARQRAEADGLPWRLPTELEWERLARGADGRPWPWGGRCASPPMLIEDTSPFGARSLCTGVAEWVEGPEGPALKGVVWDSPAPAAGRSLTRPEGCPTGVRLVRSWGGA